MPVLPTESLLHLFHLCLSNHVLVCVCAILQWFVYRYLLFKPERSVGFGSSNLSLGKKISSFHLKCRSIEFFIWMSFIFGDVYMFLVVTISDSWCYCVNTYGTSITLEKTNGFRKFWLCREELFKLIDDAKSKITGQ